MPVNQGGMPLKYGSTGDQILRHQRGRRLAGFWAEEHGARKKGKEKWGRQQGQ
jgi:hypothetical protein